MLHAEKEVTLYKDVSNPLDSIEEIMLNNDWTFDRINQDEMSVHISGNHGTYKMFFAWQEDFSALQFYCTPDLTISQNNLKEAADVVNKINNSLWLGHFDIRTQKETNGSITANLPCFRHTSLFRGMTDTSGVEHMEDLIDIALHESERYYVAFELLSKRSSSTSKDISLALMDVSGIA